VGSYANINEVATQNTKQTNQLHPGQILRNKELSWVTPKTPSSKFYINEVARQTQLPRRTLFFPRKKNSYPGWDSMYCVYS
jgi:hypothetical protein